MSENKVLMAYDNNYFNNALHCVFCKRSFESGGIEFGFELNPKTGRIVSNSAICQQCMKKGPESWKEMLRSEAQELKSIDWEMKKRQSERRAQELESAANEKFVMPTTEEQEAIRAEYPGEWGLYEWEDKPDGSRVAHVLSAQGERTTECVTIPAPSGGDVPF